MKGREGKTRVTPSTLMFNIVSRVISFKMLTKTIQQETWIYSGLKSFLYRKIILRCHVNVHPEP